MNRDDWRYCPRCAEHSEWRDAGHPPSLQPVCQSCGFVAWQNLKPSVEALIVRDDGSVTQVLLGRLGMGPGKGRWDIPGGFLNADDRLHDALRRECLREMGVDVAIGELLGVFEDEFAGSRIISIIYVCRIASGEPRAADIVDEVAWFPIDQTPEIAYPAVRDALASLRERIGR
ncbi:MAG: NUDIX hydrolase [Chloroflexi bacterium]|nr:NUDIX hydrolase [Chloroflexota bacterium]